MSLIIQMYPEIKSKILLSWKLGVIEMMVPLSSLCLQGCFVRTLQSCGTRCAAGAAFWSGLVSMMMQSAFCSLQNFLLSTCNKNQTKLLQLDGWGSCAALKIEVSRFAGQAFQCALFLLLLKLLCIRRVLCIALVSFLCFAWNWNLWAIT